MSELANYYHILGLTPSATPEQVRMSYVRLVKQHHPDRVPHAAPASRLEQLQRAYHCLRDAERKADHDRLLVEREQAHRSAIRRVKRRISRLDRGSPAPRPRARLTARRYLVIATSGGLLAMLAHLLLAS